MTSVYSNQAVSLPWAGPHIPPSPIIRTQSGVTQNITVNESAYYQWGEQMVEQISDVDEMT
jgi:hypothetical protein